MKKSLIAMMLAMGAGSVMAAGVTPTAFQGNSTVAPADCPQLAGTVTVGVSANVWGAWGCDEGTNTIKVGACHKGGSRNTIEPCASIDAGADTIVGTADDVWNYKWCDDTNIGTIPQTAEGADYNAYVVGSNGGTVAGTALGGACSDANLNNLGFWK